MDIKFWGVRGTRPVVNKEFLNYGGNTSCVEISTDNNEVIFDAGTGIINLGNRLLSDNSKEINIFLTHTHWDHIQGLPYFKPLYNNKNKIKIFGIGNNKFSFKEILEKQMSMEYFPVQWKDLKSHSEIIEINETSKIQIGDFKIEAIEATHTSRCLSYKLTCNNIICAYITDNEWAKGDAEKLIEFIKQCDLLIVDTFFTDEEYYHDDLSLSKVGWGHSTWQQGVELGIKSGAKKIVCFHHNESKNDEELGKLEKKARKVLNNICFAKEGMVISL
ncbi:MAG: MBL fold metallo-hydrolase [Sedimentibacter sp.]